MDNNCIARTDPTARHNEPRACSQAHRSLTPTRTSRSQLAAKSAILYRRCWRGLREEWEAACRVGTRLSRFLAVSLQG
ncbi:hypothetical protein PC121_g13003 [Phytophthora cactorum]|nr:hypothetical protein PC120_g21183 [Phytophthora cactorum]KAG3061425.1 hypothetical protein PC121_g13003 [Phytophthora cactorum]